jgi:hypothetical protein
MLWVVIKLTVTCALVVAISETAKRSSLLGAALASIPVISVLGILWLYVDTRDSTQVAHLSTSIFWLVIPSLLFFVILPLLLKAGYRFFPSLGLSIAAMVMGYACMALVLTRCGVKL